MKSRYDAIRDLTNMLATTLVFSDSVQNVIINGTLYDAVNKLRKSCKLRIEVGTTLLQYMSVLFFYI